MTRAKRKGKSNRRGTTGLMSPERLQLVEDLVARLWSNGKITRALTDPKNPECFRGADGHPVTERTIENYIARVYENLATEAERCKPGRRERLRAAIEDHYNRALREGKFSAAGQDLDRIAKLEGCYVERVEVTGKDGEPLMVSVDDAVRSLAEKIASLKEAKGDGK